MIKHKIVWGHALYARVSAHISWHSTTKRLFILVVVLTSCKCDGFYNRDEKILSKLSDYQKAFVLISTNYQFLKSNGLSFKSGSPGLEGLSIDYKEIKQLADKNDDQIVASIKQIWNNNLIEQNGEIKYYLQNNSSSIDFCVKKCSQIEHRIYFGQDDMYDHRGQSDDFSTFVVDTLDGHWRYIIQQVNRGQ